MKFRFKVYEVSKNGGSGLVAGQAPVLNTNFSNLTFTLAIDGVAIHTGAAVVGSNTTSVNGVDVITTFSNAGQVTIEIPTTSISTRHEFFIRIISSNGFNAYENIFPLFGYDLGNDATQVDSLNLPVTGNKDFDFVLVDSTALDTYSKFVGYNIPLTDNMQLVELSSTTGTTSYFNFNGVLITQGKSSTAGIQNGQYRSGTYSGAQGTWQYSNYELLELFTYCPDVVISIINRGPQTGLCFSTTGKVAQANIDFSTSTQVRVSDAVSTLFDNPQLLYNLRDRIGTLIGTIVIPLDFSAVYTTGFNPTSTWWSLPELNITESYTVEASLISDCAFTCISTLKLPFCYTEDLTHVSCNDYVITNNNPVNIVVSIKQLQEVEFVEINNYVLTPSSVQSVSLEDGLYEFNFVYGDQSYSRIVLADCVVKSCILDLTGNFITNSVTVTCTCSQDCNCDSASNITSKDYFDVNLLTTLYIQYLNLINHLYVVNPIFTTLSDPLKDTVIEIDKLLKTFTTICKNCD